MEQMGGVGMLMFVAGNAASKPALASDGQTIMEHAEKLVDRLIDCAKENEGLYKTLCYLVTGTVWTALSMEVVAIVWAILKNHGVNPLELLKKKQGGKDGNDNLSELSNAA